MRSRVALLLALLLLATAALALIAQTSSDPLAQYRAADGSLHIPGGALTPELQHLIFGGNDLQPYFNLSYYAPVRSPYATTDLVERGYLVPNPNVFLHPSREPQTIVAGIAHAVARWFPPVDWGAQLRAAAGWLFGLFTWNARAAVTVDTTTATDVAAVANTCTTSQTTGATDNAVLVLLSERGTTTFLSVTYGSASLSLVTGTGANGGAVVRTEIWAFAGALPAGLQTMTATLSGGATAKMTCATLLLQNVKAVGSFINGTSNSAATANATITLGATVSVGNLAFAVAALQNAGGGTQPTAVAGTGAAAADLYGVTTVHCSGAGASNECAAGADIANPGTAITWTNPATPWVVSAVEVVAVPTCGTVGGGNCYRIGNNGTWTTAANWSNTPGGASCGCTPATTDFAIFNASPSGTTSLSAATTIASIDMTAFTGTLDTTNANNWPLTVNGDFTIQGTFLARGSTVAVTGNVTIVGAATVVTMSTSTWTVNGIWTNNSTAATWSAGTSSVTIKDAGSGALTFGNLGVNEFNNLTLDASVAAGVTYTMAANGLRAGGTLLIQNSTAGATGSTILNTSASNLAITAGALTLATFGAANTGASNVTVNGNVTISNVNAYVANTGGNWVVTGAWSDSSTSASWSFAAAMSFRSTANRTMTFGPQAGNEFSGPVTFDTTVTTAVTYLMASNALDVGGALTIQNSAAGATGAVTLDTSAGNLAVNAASLTLSTLGTFNTRASTITISGGVLAGAASAYITNTGGAWSVSGSWTDRTTSASWSFAAAMTFRAAASQSMIFTGSNIAGNEFSGAVVFDSTVAGGVTYTMAANTTGDSALRIGSALTLRNTAGGATAATLLDTSAGNYSVTAASLTLGAPRGALRSEGSTITINGAVTISDANSYLVLGSASWTVAGAWTNGSTDSVDWSAGTGTLTFRSAASASMTFANLAANEANNVIFDTTTAAGITYTMATNGLRIAGTLMVQNTAATPTGNTVLTTTGLNLAITAGGIVVGTRGTLIANGSTITVNGSWTATAANHVWTKGTSTVVFAATGTLAVGAGDSFNILTQSAGTTTLASNVTISGATTVNGTLDTSGSSFGLTMQSTLSIGAVGVLNIEASTASTTGNVTIATGGAVRFTGAGTWTINGSWTDSNSTAPASWAVGTATVKIVDGAATTLTFWTAAANEFNNLTLDSSVAAGFMYTQANPLQTAGTLTVQNTAAGATGAVIFDASASNYTSTLGGLNLGALGGFTSRTATVTVNGNASIAASGYVTNTGAGTWTITGAWTDSSSSASWSFAAPITFRSAGNQTMTFKAAGTEFGGSVTFDTALAAGVTYTMATNGLRLSGALTIRNSVALPTGNAVLDTSAANLGITAGSVTLGTNGTLLARGSTISVGGNWTANATNVTFTAGTSTVVFTAAATINMTQSFNNLAITAGTSTLAANLTVSASLTASGGVLAKGTFTLTAASLTLSGGGLTSASGAGTVTGSVTISSAVSYIAFGSETWTIGGAWTNSSTSASWSAGTGTVMFDGASSATMVFAGSGLAGNEFNNVTFDTTSTAGITYTMSTGGLQLGGALTIQNSAVGASGATVLDTSSAGLAVTVKTVTIGTYGTLSANGSTITVTGNWTATAANAAFAAGASTVTFAASATVASAQAFYNLTVTAGTLTAGTNLTAGNAVTLSGGTLAKSTFTLSMGSLTLSGGALTSTSGSVTVTGNVNIPAATSYIAFGSEAWTVSGAWTNASTSASWNPGTGSITFGSPTSQTMSVAGANLGVNEFANVTFNSGAATATFTLAAQSLRVAGTLTIGGGSAVTTLDTGASNLAVTANALSVIAGGSFSANGSIITVTSVDTHLGTLTPGSSTIVINGSGGTVDVPQTVNNLTVNAGLSTSFTGSLTWSGTFVLTGATVDFGPNSLTSSGAATIAFASATITMTTGSWDTSSATGFTATGSSVAFSGTGSLKTGASSGFAALAISGGTRSLLGPLTVNGLLTVSGGVLGKGSNPLTASAGLTLSGGALTSTSGAVTVGGNVDISAAASYIAFGSESWTVSGSWTNVSTSASWVAGTGTVLFASTASQTMTFGALPANAPEFHNVTFNGGASTVTYAMATNALTWAGALTVQGGTGTTTLATGGLGLTGGSLSIGNAGLLAAGASAVSVGNVSMTGGASGSITITTGSWTVSGNWNTSGAGSALSAGTSTVSFVGTSTTIALASGQMLYNVGIGGTVSLLSGFTAAATLNVNSGAVLTKTGQSLTFNNLTENGTGSVLDGSVNVMNLAIANSDSTNLTTSSVFTIWSADLEFTWTDSSTVGTSTLTFTIGGNTSGNRFNVSKDGAAFGTGIVNASGQIVFTMLGSDPVVDVVVANPCGSARYWVGGTGTWSSTGHWSSASGGAGGCSAPSPAMTAIADGNSGSGTITLDQNATIAGLNTTGWAGTIALGTFNLAVNGSLTSAAGTITIGSSTGTGLTVAGNLTLSGTAVLDGSGAASLVSVVGNVSITSSTASFRMGSGTWAFGGSWSNSSTSANWAPGTGTVLFNSTASQTMTFAAFAGREFYNVTFASTANSGVVVFTMVTNPLKWANLLTIQDSAGSTTAVATAGLSLTGGSLTVGNSGILTANASVISLVNVTMNAGTSGTMTLTAGAWTVSGNWDTSGVGSVFTKGTSTVTMSGATGTIRILGSGAGFYNLSISGTLTLGSALDVSGSLSVTGTLTTSGNAVTGGANLTVSGGGSLIASTSSLFVASVTMNDASANALSLTTGSISDSGSWDTSGAPSTFSPGTSSVTLTGASGTIALGASQAFAALGLAGGYTLASQLSALSLALSSGALTKGAYSVTVNGDLTLSGGALISISGGVTVAGNVSISSASSYIVFGSEAWTISGSWTNDSTSSSWAAGSGSVTFNASANQTMTFAGSHLPGREFNGVVFNAGSSTVSFAMASAALIAGTITVRGGSGATTLDTSGSNLALTADTLTVASGGVLLANGSLLSVRSIDTSAGSFTTGTSTVVINAAGGSVNVPQTLSSLTVNPGLTATFASNITWSGSLTLTGTTATFSGNLTSSGAATISFGSATIAIGGSWTTPSAATLISLGSTVTFTGSGQTITLGSAQQFASLAIAGSIDLGSAVTATTLSVNPGSTLAKTGYSITFNRLSVAGTITDGSANVGNLTVANSDTTALVTISVFTTWSVGTTYAWTHASNEASQTITWTIGGNTAGDLYRVTKDGAAYSNGTVDKSGQIVFTMLGSDPGMQVIVMPPPIPGWWQSPYFLAIPPIGFLMVVAMFVQRRRWRPAKAFLVDERGQLLREFTLDPSCKVTYDQALQAGALDAVDKDVRVSKYHARAVRGDMLSLVMLAVGPANVEEVEFAREILVNVQDKFDDRVKQRVEDARAEESNLEAVMQQAEEERADLQARSRAFGDMVNAFTIARGKIDTESRAIQEHTLDLNAREQALSEDRKSLEDQAKELKQLRGSLEETSAQLAQEKEAIAGTLASLEVREANLSPKEQDLTSRESVLSAKESDQAEREANLSDAESKLTADLEDHHAKAQDLGRLEKELAEERKSLDDLTTQLDQQQTTVNARVTDVDSREKTVTTAAAELETKLAGIEPRENALIQRESDLTAQETAHALKEKALADEEERLNGLATDLRTQEATLSSRTEDLMQERKAVDDLTQQAVQERKGLDDMAASLQEQEAEVAKNTKDLADLKANLGPREAALLDKETDLQNREKTLADDRATLQGQQDLVAAKALELQQQMEAIQEQEAAIQQEKTILQDAKAAFESEQKDLESKVAALEQETKQREAELAEQAKALGEATMRLTKDRQDFDAHQEDKNQWIASKEIELEAKEQGLTDREAEIRAQAEENAKNLTELAAREETLEIESAKVDKTRAELEGRKAELGAMSREVETRTAKLRDEETRKGEELRTWQATLESEQALLKEQKETFDKEMQDLRESWAGRMIRVEQREEELKEREAKVQTDIEWVARNESEVGKREKLAAENLKIANDSKAEAERLHMDVEQRSLEVESRERTVREEAADRSVELEKRTESLQVAEAELAGRKAQWERELATQTQKLKDREADLASRKESLDSKEADLVEREATLAGSQDAVRQDEDRLGRERLDLQMTQKNLEAGQLELTQARDKLDAETLRQQTEADAVRQSLAAKEADLRTERERLERDSTSLQDKLGTKAKELAGREKGVAAREDELRSEEHDLEARIRELESRERQTEARLAEITAREGALAHDELEQKSRRTEFDESVQRFEMDAAARQKEWKDLQATLRSQEEQLAASTETRQAEIRKRMEDLEQREHSLNATQTQAQIERTRLEAQAKAQSTRQSELEASIARADKRFGELKSMEEDLLRARQSFESEKTGWSARRGEEMKQLEATRDAAAEQAQQSERLIEESQRRVYVAAEAEKAAKRQAEELAAAQSALERRRADAEKAEKDLDAQMAQLRDASQRLAAKEVELGSRAKELEALQTRLAGVEKKGQEAAEELKGRKTSLDQESERIAALAAQMDKRQAEDESRRGAIEGKLSELSKREQILTTELQRADNLMEDLNRKDAEITMREKGFLSKEGALATREAGLAQRDGELAEGMQTLERMRREHEARANEVDEHHRVAAQTRKEAEAIAADAQKMKAQAEAMQAEVSKNMRFLQKKALDVLDREEKIRSRENKSEQEDKVLGARGQILEKKERALEADRDELAAKLEKVKQENEKLKAKLVEAEKQGKSTIDMDEWKRDIENRVKIIQKKALDLLDREEKLRKKEEELNALAAQLDVAKPQ